MIPENRTLSTHSPPVLLVISYDQMLCDILLDMLKSDYHHVLSATHTQSLTFLKQEPITLIILDLLKDQTPDWEFLELLYSISTIQQYSIILIRNFDFPDDIHHTIDDYLDLENLQQPQLLLKIALQLKRKQHDIEQMNIIQELKRKQETHRNLAQMASHDLRHPMTNIRISEVMLREFLSDPSNKPFLDSLLVSINNMETMFDDFISAMLVGERVFKYGVVDLQMCVDTVCLQYLVSANNKNIELVQGTLDYMLYGDISATEQIINNLISNAIKYSFFNSVVHITAHQEDDFIVFQVIDHGQGVIESERSLLFTEFGRVSSQPTNNEPSVGLGLWIVRQLTESMNGVVGADFPSEGGAIFWVKLPIYRGQ